MSATQTAGDIPQWTRPDRLAKARAHASMDQTDLADALGISVRSVKRYEAGDPIKRGILLGWALATGVNATWLETGVTPGGTGWYPEQYRSVSDAA